ncbi:hypothetical protein IE81DRAFT_365245 [Ceraceosorus guamensis]|uniref:Zn(2)-C6 fungal-type domain-containing protein n=1 Tax=Ceraceosorus guamensis TaxID=1522189 RepID=A0A316W2F2_9BASI|nr:hypothetical protein IE81DRAFT_365245 [Ceraceosorus guamensis]PWN44046.1 hypothetical protein IE81DRAFT_365245 [Ceraceosorus guamensis]
MPRKSAERDRMQRSTAAEEIETQTKGKGIRTPSSGGSDSSSKKRKKGTRVRIAQACNFCRNHKRRCSGTLPCELCARRGRAKECAYETSSPPVNLAQLSPGSPHSRTSTSQRYPPQASIPRASTSRVTSQPWSDWQSPSRRGSRINRSRADSIASYDTMVTISRGSSMAHQSQLERYDADQSMMQDSSDDSLGSSDEDDKGCSHSAKRRVVRHFSPTAGAPHESVQPQPEDVGMHALTPPRHRPWVPAPMSAPHHGSQSRSFYSAPNTILSTDRSDLHCRVRSSKDSIAAHAKQSPSTAQPIRVSWERTYMNSPSHHRVYTQPNHHWPSPSSSKMSERSQSPAGRSSLSASLELPSYWPHGLHLPAPAPSPSPSSSSIARATGQRDVMHRQTRGSLRASSPPAPIDPLYQAPVLDSAGRPRPTLSVEPLSNVSLPDLRELPEETIRRRPPILPREPLSPHDIRHRDVWRDLPDSKDAERFSGRAHHRQSTAESQQYGIEMEVDTVSSHHPRTTLNAAHGSSSETVRYAIGGLSATFSRHALPPLTMPSPTPFESDGSRVIAMQEADYDDRTPGELREKDRLAYFVDADDSMNGVDESRDVAQSGAMRAYSSVDSHAKAPRMRSFSMTNEMARISIGSTHLPGHLDIPSVLKSSPDLSITAKSRKRKAPDADLKFAAPQCGDGAYTTASTCTRAPVPHSSTAPIPLHRVIRSHSRSFSSASRGSGQIKIGSAQPIPFTPTSSSDSASAPPSIIMTPSSGMVRSAATWTNWMEAPTASHHFSPLGTSPPASAPAGAASAAPPPRDFRHLKSSELM